MPVGNGQFPLRIDRRGRAPTDEQKVFVACVEDVMRSAPGLRYALFLDPREVGGWDRGTYAIFLVRTNPALDLVISIELRERALVVNVNEASFRRRRWPASPFEPWVDRCCGDLEAMVRGDLRLTHRTSMSLPVTSRLEAGRDGKWQKICTATNPMVAFVSAFVPYGFLVGHSSRQEFLNWFASEESPGLEGVKPRIGTSKEARE